MKRVFSCVHNSKRQISLGSRYVIVLHGGCGGTRSAESVLFFFFQRCLFLHRSFFFLAVSLCHHGAETGVQITGELCFDEVLQTSKVCHTDAASSVSPPSLVPPAIHYLHRKRSQPVGWSGRKKDQLWHVSARGRNACLEGLTGRNEGRLLTYVLQAGKPRKPEKSYLFNFTLPQELVCSFGVYRPEREVLCRALSSSSGGNPAPLSRRTAKCEPSREDSPNRDCERRIKKSF